MLDFFAPYIALGEGIGRLGCLFAGCCYGFLYHGPFAIQGSFHPNTENLIVLTRFPLQPLAFLVGVTNFWILMRLKRKVRVEGQLGLIFLILYSISRFLLELLRGDEIRGMWFGGALSTSQIVSMVLICFATVLLSYKRTGRLQHAKAEGNPN